MEAEIDESKSLASLSVYSDSITKSTHKTIKTANTSEHVTGLARYRLETPWPMFADINELDGMGSDSDLASSILDTSSDVDTDTDTISLRISVVHAGPSD